MLLNNIWVNKDQGRNEKVSGNKSKWTYNIPIPLGHRKGSPEREVHSNTILPKENRKSQINNLILYLQELEEQQQRKPRVSRGKEKVKMRSE